MKYQTTAKALKEGYYTIISIGYCDLQNLLNYESPVAYNKGVYGWNFDIYDVDRIAIATGYRGMPSKNSNASYDLKGQGKSAIERKLLLVEFIEKCRK